MLQVQRQMWVAKPNYIPQPLKVFLTDNTVNFINRY